MIIFNAADGTIYAEPTKECIQQFEYRNRLAMGPNVDTIKYGQWELTIYKRPGDLPETLSIKDTTTGLEYNIEVDDNATGFICIQPYLGS